MKSRPSSCPTVRSSGPRPMRWVRGVRVHCRAAVTALFGAVLDRDDWTVARVRVDITATVPCKPLKLDVASLEGGRKVQRQSANLSTEDRIVARSDGCLRREHRARIAHERLGGAVAYYVRVIAPPGDPGWLNRFREPGDGTPHGWRRRPLDRGWFGLTRQPEREWVSVRADRAVVGDDGTVVSGSMLFDQHGDIGLCTELISSGAAAGARILTSGSPGCPLGTRRQPVRIFAF